LSGRFLAYRTRLTALLSTMLARGRVLATYPTSLAALVHFLLVATAGAVALEEEITDDFAMLQKEVTLSQSYFEEDEDEADVYSAMQMEVGLLHGNRHVGTGQRFSADLEEDTFDGASLFQSESSLISKDAGKKCTFGKTSDEEPDVVSLLQTDAVHQRRVESTAYQDDDETALFQTTITLGKGMRRVGNADLAEDDEDEIEDGTAFLQANVGLEQGGHASTEGLNLKGVKICRREHVEDDEEEDDEVSL